MFDDIMCFVAGVMIFVTILGMIITYTWIASYNDYWPFEPEPIEVVEPGIMDGIVVPGTVGE